MIHSLRSAILMAIVCVCLYSITSVECAGVSLPSSYIQNGTIKSVGKDIINNRYVNGMNGQYTRYVKQSEEVYAEKIVRSYAFTNPDPDVFPFPLHSNIRMHALNIRKLNNKKGYLTSEFYSWIEVNGRVRGECDGFGMAKDVKKFNGTGANRFGDIYQFLQQTTSNTKQVNVYSHRTVFDSHSDHETDSYATTIFTPLTNDKIVHTQLVDRSTAGMIAVSTMETDFFTTSVDSAMFRPDATCVGPTTGRNATGSVLRPSLQGGAMASGAAKTAVGGWWPWSTDESADDDSAFREWVKQDKNDPEYDPNPRPVEKDTRHVWPDPNAQIRCWDLGMPACAFDAVYYTIKGISDFMCWIDTGAKCPPSGTVL